MAIPSISKTIVIKANNLTLLIFFFIVDLLYKFLKEEVNAVKKYMNNSKILSFEYKGLTFTWNKVPKRISFRYTYFDNLEIQFSISKMDKKIKERK